MMTPALAFFYGGLVESKNFLNQLFLSMVCMGIVPVQWCLFGYSFVFGPGNGYFGSFDFAIFRTPGQKNIYSEDSDSFTSPTSPTLAFAGYQCAFAIITPALISGAVVGRMKLLPYMIFIFFWSTFCYNPLARWIFYSQGWLVKMGSIDFAGGCVVHLSSGVSALVAAIILGSRAQFDPDVVHTGQTKLPFTVLGTGLLWVGWMGFNGGSALAADGIAALAVFNTNAAAAASMIIWMMLDLLMNRFKNQNANIVSIPGACSAIVVGLVVITPAAGYIQPGYAVLFGVSGGSTVFFFVLGKKHFFPVDDTLDVFSFHGLGGLIGTLLTGIFCQKDVNSVAPDGMAYGHPIQLWYQLAAALVTIGYSVACTAVILLPMHYLIGIRLAREDQVRGLDNIAHGVIVEDKVVQQVRPAILKQKQVQPWENC